MFTGIIEANGRVERFMPVAGDWRLVVSSANLDFSDIKIGDSIAVSGVCLTVTTQDGQSFTADVSNETVACTSMKTLSQGALVNLEKAMTPSSRLGGHLVSGHVDGLAILLSREGDGRSESLWFRAPQGLARYIARKGSVCLEGVSLTVNEVKEADFSVNIIPHTAAQTTLHLFQPGRQVNLEVDIISRYLERLLTAPEAGTGTASINMEFLAKNGFVGTRR
ncbi:MAG: riboflavin synthase [Pseudomonadales bacterium]|nr:riboflavin synthase [Pseudomonadales bacterium]